MEEYTQITLTEWMEWKEDIRRKLAETADNFVYIGYRLRQIRDSGMMDGCEDIFEFAQREYGLSKSTVSRFIAINEKFASLADPLHLQPEYIGIGHSKLSEMLTLSDEDCELIAEKTTVKAIRELKQMEKEEKAAPAEENQGFSAVATSQQPKKMPLEVCIEDFFSNESRAAVLDYIMDDHEEELSEEKVRELAELINPSGNGTHRKGLVMLFFYDPDKGVKYRQMGLPAPQSLQWAEFLGAIRNLYREDAEAAGGQLSVWECHYKKREETAIETPEEVEEEPRTAPAAEETATEEATDPGEQQVCSVQSAAGSDGAGGTGESEGGEAGADTVQGVEEHGEVSEPVRSDVEDDTATAHEDHGHDDLESNVETSEEGLCREIRDSWEAVEALLEPDANVLQLKAVGRRLNNMIVTLNQLIEFKQRKDEYEE